MKTTHFDYLNRQLHAGPWHTDTQGRYWSGNWSHRAPRQLFDECVATINDLRRNHESLREHPIVIIGPVRPYGSPKASIAP